MTRQQAKEVGALFAGWQELHHGDCVGADAEAHDLFAAAGSLTNRIVVHPPTDARLRAFVKDADETLIPLPYLERNAAIVEATDALIAAPAEDRQSRSGTWWTVGYARRLKRPIAIVFPDGSIRTTHWEGHR